MLRQLLLSEVGRLDALRAIQAPEGLCDLVRQRGFFGIGRLMGRDDGLAQRCKVRHPFPGGEERLGAEPVREPARSATRSTRLRENSTAAYLPIWTPSRPSRSC